MTGKSFGLCMIDIKSPMTRVILEALADLVHTRLHYLLTRQDREGEMDSMRFRELTYPLVKGCVEQVSQFFGEDGTVWIDLNLDYHGPRAMEHLYAADLKVVLGVMREEGWRTCPLAEGRLDHLMELFA